MMEKEDEIFITHISGRNIEEWLVALDIRGLLHRIYKKGIFGVKIGGE